MRSPIHLADAFTVTVELLLLAGLVIVAGMGLLASLVFDRDHGFDLELYRAPAELKAA